jgi:hypothetical protein
MQYVELAKLAHMCAKNAHFAATKDTARELGDPPPLEVQLVEAV